MVKTSSQESNLPHLDLKKIYICPAAKEMQKLISFKLIENKIQCMLNSRNICYMYTNCIVYS